MTKQTIEVDGLPEGWKVVAYRVPLENKDYILDGDQVLLCCWPPHKNSLIIEKIQPRRIVLEDTGEERSISYGDWYEDDEGNVHKYLNKSFGSRRTYKTWREVKETDIPLTNSESKLTMGVSQGDGEPTLELSVKEVMNVRSLIKDFENLGWFINPERALLLQKITEFIKDK